MQKLKKKKKKHGSGRLLSFASRITTLSISNEEMNILKIVQALEYFTEKSY